MATEDTGYRENRACSAGADCSVQKPLHLSLLKVILFSLGTPARETRPTVMTGASPFRGDPSHSSHRSSGPDLAILRDISRILSHSLDYEQLVEHFVLKLREIIGVNRVAIFLETPQASLIPPLPRHASNLRCVCMIGIPTSIQDHFELSKKGGIGQWVTDHGQILRLENAGSIFAPADFVKIQREFEVLSCQVAIPINDREKTIGVALLGGHLTRIGFSDEELQLIFHLMEELGLSVKNCWLHEQLSRNNQLFHEVFYTLQSGCIVIGPDLDVIEANPAAIAFLNLAKDQPLEFADVPGKLASLIHGAVEQDEIPAPFFLSLPDDRNGRLCRTSILPIDRNSPGNPRAVMVVLEDFTEMESARTAKAEASNHQLTAVTAKRFAQETRNSLEPLTTHLQRIEDDYDHPQFRESLKSALKSETGRISRFTEQLLFLSQTATLPENVASLEKLLREGFADALHYSEIDGILDVRNTNGRHIRCHFQSLKLAFQEIFINALESGGPGTQVAVTVRARDGQSSHLISIRFRDSGPGFSPEVARRAHEPFFTTRDRRIGLGLTIAKKIIEDHDGNLDIRPRESNDLDIVVVLPSESIQHD